MAGPVSAERGGGRESGGRSTTCAVRESSKTKDRDEVAKYIGGTGCRESENRHGWVEDPQVVKVLVIGPGYAKSDARHPCMKGRYR